MAQIVKWGAAGAQAINAFAEQTRINAKAEAALSHEADANRRAEEQIQIQKDANARANAAEARTAAQWGAGIETANTSIRGWDPDRDMTGASADLIERFESVQLMVDEWKAMPDGEDREAHTLALSAAISGFNATMARRQAHADIMAEVDSIQEMGSSLPEELEEDIARFMGGSPGSSGDKGGGGGIEPAELLARLRAFGGAEIQAKARAREAGDMRNFALEAHQFLSSDKIPRGEDGKPTGLAAQEAEKAISEMLEMLGPGTTVAERRSQFSKLKGYMAIVGDPDASAEWDHRVGALNKEKENTEYNRFYAGAGRNLKGSSVFTVLSEGLNDASVHGGGELFGLGYNTPELQKLRTIADNVIKTLMEEYPDRNDLTRMELLTEAHERIVHSDELLARALLSPGDQGLVLEAYRAFADAFPKDRMKTFDLDLGLMHMAEKGEPFIEGKRTIDRYGREAVEGHRTKDPHILLSSSARVALGDAFQAGPDDYDPYQSVAGTVGMGRSGVREDYPHPPAPTPYAVESIENLMLKHGLASEDLEGKQFHEILGDHPGFGKDVYGYMLETRAMAAQQMAADEQEPWYQFGLHKKEVAPDGDPARTPKPGPRVLAAHPNQGVRVKALQRLTGLSTDKVRKFMQPLEKDVAKWRKGKSGRDKKMPPWYNERLEKRLSALKISGYPGAPEKSQRDNL